MRGFRVLAFAAVVALASSPSLQAQTLMGFDGTTATAVQFDMGPGGACPPAVPLLAGTPTAGIAVCAAAPVIAPPGGPGATLLGDVAVDRLTDVTYVTDGFAVFEFVVGDAVLGPPPGTPIHNWGVPAIPTPAGFMGPITGMGMDGPGLLAGGVPTLWVTDGVFIAGIGVAPPGSCLAPFISVPAFAHGIVGGPFLTDITIDPFTGTFWACGAGGGVFNVAVGGGLGPGGAFAAGICGAVAPLTGIAYDLSSPGIPAFTTNQPAPSLLVTDGAVIEYIDTTTAGPAAPTFYHSGGPCLPTPAPLNGLAWTSHSVNWGAPPGATAFVSTGQSSTPGPTFGIGMTGGTPGSNVWIFFGINVPGSPSGGFFCPPLPSLGSLLYVDIFTPPGGLIFLGAMPGTGVFFLPAPIGPAPPPGVMAYAQFLEDISTTGVGPFTLTDPALITMTAP